MNIIKEKIDVDSWERKQTFTHFSNFSIPYVGITSIVNVDDVVRYAKETGETFYGLMSYLALKTINEIEEFQYVLENNEVYKYGVINMTCSVVKPDNKLNFTRSIPYNPNMQEFLKTFKEAKREAESDATVPYSSEMNTVYITCTPWMRFTSVQNPINLNRVDSVPRICWGKYFETPQGYNIDLAIQVNHAFQDGLYIGMFYQQLQTNINNVKEMSECGKENILRRS